MNDEISDSTVDDELADDATMIETNDETNEDHNARIDDVEMRTLQDLVCDSIAITCEVV